jgi:hypothetical protein
MHVEASAFMRLPVDAAASSGFLPEALERLLTLLKGVEG